MNNENIKEILDKFDKILENYELDKKFGQMSVDSICHLFPSEMVAIKDYITNLQEEVKSANESITWWTNRFNAIQRDNERLKELCDKYEEEHSTRFNDWVFDKRENERLKAREQECLDAYKRARRDVSEYEDKYVVAKYVIEELEKYLEEEQIRLARETSNIYKDSLGKTKLVNDDIFNEITRIKDKLKELKEGKENE